MSATKRLQSTQNTKQDSTYSYPRTYLTMTTTCHIPTNQTYYAPHNTYASTRTGLDTRRQGRTPPTTPKFSTIWRTPLPTPAALYLVVPARFGGRAPTSQIHTRDSLKQERANTYPHQAARGIKHLQARWAGGRKHPSPVQKPARGERLEPSVGRSSVTTIIGTQPAVE